MSPEVILYSIARMGLAFTIEYMRTVQGKTTVTVEDLEALRQYARPEAQVKAEAAERLGLPTG